MTTRTTTGF